MDVILLTDVDKLGTRGEVVGVARGYARNFLLPRKMAEVATPAKLKELERREAQRARHDASNSDQARDIAARLEQLELRFDVNAGPTGSLFGSVTPSDIACSWMISWSATSARVRSYASRSRNAAGVGHGLAASSHRPESRFTRRCVQGLA